MRKKTIIAVVAIVLLGLVWMYYGYLYKGKRNISNEEPAFTVSAAQLMQEYGENQQKADAAFLNKTLEITGKVTHTADSVITIEPGVVCSFSNKATAAVPAKTVTIKGRCIGYDELFNEVKLDQCTIKE